MCWCVGRNGSLDTLMACCCFIWTLVLDSSWFVIDNGLFQMEENKPSAIASPKMDGYGTNVLAPLLQGVFG